MLWSFERPWLLLLIPFIITVWWYVQTKRQAGFIFPPVADNLPVSRWTYLRRLLVPGSFALAVLLTVTALAGPYHGYSELVQMRQRRYFMMMADVSGSVDDLLEEILTMSALLVDHYEEDVADLTLFGTYARTLANFNGKTLALYMTPDGRFRDGAQDLIAELKTGTTVDRALWRSFRVAMYLRLKRMTREELAVFRNEVLRNGAPSAARRAAIEQAQEDPLEGVVAIMVTDVNFQTEDFPPPALLEVMQAWGIRLFVIDVDGSDNNNDKDVLRYAERVWNIDVQGGDNAVLQRLRAVFAEIDQITEAEPLPEVQRLRATRVPHCAALALMMLAIGSMAFLSKRLSPIPL